MPDGTIIDMHMHTVLGAYDSGLKPEDRVVVSGLLMLRPGIKVRLADAAAPAPSGATGTSPGKQPGS